MGPVDKLAYLQLQITQVYRRRGVIGLTNDLWSDLSLFPHFGQSIIALKWEQSIQHVLTIYMSTWQTARLIVRPKTMALRVFGDWRYVCVQVSLIFFYLFFFFFGFHFHLSAAF